VEGIVAGAVTQAERSEGVVGPEADVGEKLSHSDVPSPGEEAVVGDLSEDLLSLLDGIAAAPCVDDAWLSDAAHYEDPGHPAAIESDAFIERRSAPARVGAIYLEDLEDMDLLPLEFDDIPLEYFSF